MVHFEYVCDACGFASEEERGVYKCPKCGAQMRAAKTGAYSGDKSPVMGRWIITIICFFIFMVFGIVLLGPLGIVIAFILTFFVWRFFRKASRDQAIRKDNLKNPQVMYSCNNCGGKFKGQLPKCPHCGTRLKY